MRDNSFIKHFLGSNEGQDVAPLIKEKLPFEEVIKRYYLWQISGVNVMQADEVRTGNVHIVDKYQPWNIISAWGLGYFDGGCIRQLYNWSQTGDLNYLKAAQHYLSKMLEEEAKKGARKQPPVASATITPPPPQTQEIVKEIDAMAKRLTIGPGTE